MKKLTLRSEALSSLDGDELAGVAGGTTTAVSRFVNPCVTVNDPVCHLYSNLVTGGCVPTYHCAP